MITQIVQVCTEDEKFDNCMQAMGELEEKDTCIVFAERKGGAISSIESCDKAASTVAAPFTAIKTNTSAKNL